MQLIKFSVVLLLVLAVANCFDEPYSMQYSYLPDVQLGTFEGSYTSSPPGGYGYGLWMCQDENVVFGSYDEVGIFNGQVQAGNVLNGTWYEAGTGSCVTGTFAITLTSWGFDGWYDCAGNSNLRYNWTETKINAFRPSDGDCAIMDLSSTHTLSGRFEEENQLPKDFCYDSSVSNATISFLYMEDDGTTQKGYFEGTAYQNGQIFIGTWYTPTPSAGANLYYLDENGLVHCFFWTGLNGTTGDTVINPAEYFQEEKHFHVHYTGPISATSSSNCKDYSLIKNTVLNNLVDGNPNDNHYYYFVTSDFYNFDYVYNVTASSASSIQVFYLLSFVLALFLF